MGYVSSFILWDQLNILINILRIQTCCVFIAGFKHCRGLFQPDDVEGKIREIVPAGFTSNGDDFISLLEKEANFKPFGTLLHSYTVHSEEAGELTYQIHKVPLTFLSSGREKNK